MNKIFLCQRASKRGSLLALIGLLCLQTSAQLTRDYTFVKQSDPWLTCENAAALARYNTSSIALAELALTSAKGGFVNYYDSPDVLQVGAAVLSHQQTHCGLWQDELRQQVGKRHGWFGFHRP